MLHVKAYSVYVGESGGRRWEYVEKFEQRPDSYRPSRSGAS